MSMKRICLLLFTISVVFVLLSFKAGANPDPSWLSGWSYRKYHNITNATGAGTNYQIKIVVANGTGSDSGDIVYINNETRSDFGDIRFTDDDGTTVLDYWMEEVNSAENATFWIEVADDLSTANQTIYIYYGNSSGTITSNGTNTFIIYDDMEGTTGNVPTSYTDSSSSDCEFKISDTQAHTGTKSAGNQDNNINGWAQGLRDDVTNSFQSLNYFGYFPQTTQVAYLYTYQTGTTGLVAIVGFSSDGKVYAYDGTTSTEIMASYYTDQWYHVEIIFDYTNKQYDVYIDGILEADNFGFYTGTATQSKSFKFVSGKTYASTDYWYWDDVFDRKYVSPEPSHGSWGSEESSTENSVTLNSPTGTQTSLTISFNFTPTFYQAIQNASVYTNETGSWTREETNSSAITNDSPNIINHTLPSTAEGTILWNVGVWNSTNEFFATSNATFTLDIIPRYQNVGSNATSILENGTILLYSQGYDGIGLGNAWLWTNETGGIGKNYSQLWTYQNSLIYDSDKSFDSWQHLIKDGDMIYFGLISTNYSKAYVGAYNTSSDTFNIYFIGNTPFNNYHNNPQIFLDKWGYLWAFTGYSSTEEAYNIWWSRSTNPHDSTSWSSPTNFATGAAYPYAYQDSTSGRIYVYYRRYESDLWCYSYTDNNGTSWTNYQTTIWPSNQTYPTPQYAIFYAWAHFDPSTQRLHVVAVGNRTGEVIEVRENVYYAYSDDYGATWKAINGTTVTSPPKIWAGNSSRAYMTLDENNYPLIAVSFENWNTGEDYLKFIYWNSSSWTVKTVASDVDIELCGAWHNSIQKYDDKIHIFSHRYKSGVTSRTQMHYYAESPYDSWSSENWGDGTRGITTEIENNKLYWIFNGDTSSGSEPEKSKQYLINFTIEDVYDSPVNMNNIADTWTWSNFTWSNNSITAGTAIAWRIYYNDTSGNENKTDIMTYTVKKSDGSYCSANIECLGGYCVHGICRSASTHCGDGYCDSSETCSSCSSDCGACGPSVPPGPSGCPHTIRIKNVEDIDAKAGETAIAEITVKNTGCYDEGDIRIYIECADDWECGSTTIAELKKHESMDVDLEIKVPIEAAPKIYHFDVIAENAFYRNVDELDVIIGELCKKDSDCEVGEICLDRICQGLFDIKIVRADSPIEPGEFLDFTYLMKSISNISGDVKVNFWIEDKDGMKVSEGSEVIFIDVKDEKLIESNLFVPSDVLGMYSLFVQLDTQGLTTIASKTIEIAKEEAPLISDVELPEEKEQPVPTYIFLLIIGILAVFNYRNF